MNARLRRATIALASIGSACGGGGEGCPNLVSLRILGRGAVEIELGDGARICEGAGSPGGGDDLGHSTENGARATAWVEAGCGRHDAADSVPAGTTFVGWIRNDDCRSFTDATTITLTDDDRVALAHFETPRTAVLDVEEGLRVTRAPIVVEVEGVRSPFGSPDDLECPGWQVRRPAETCPEDGHGCEVATLLDLPVGLTVSGLAEGLRPAWDCTVEVTSASSEGFVIDEGLVAERITVVAIDSLACSVQTVPAARLEDTVEVRWELRGEGLVSSSLGAPCVETPACQDVERGSVTTLTVAATDDGYAPGAWTCPGRPSVTSDQIAVRAETDTLCHHEMHVGVDVRVRGPARPTIFTDTGPLPGGTGPVYVHPGTEIRVEVWHSADLELRKVDCPLAGEQTAQGFRSDPVRVVEPVRCEVVVE